MPIDTVADVLAMYEALGEEGTWTYTSPDGSPVPVMVIINPLYDDVSSEGNINRQLFEVSIPQSMVPEPERNSIISSSTVSYKSDRVLEKDGREVVLECHEVK